MVPLLRWARISGKIWTLLAGRGTITIAEEVNNVRAVAV